LAAVAGFVQRKAAEIEVEAQGLANGDLVLDDQRTSARRVLRHPHIVAYVLARFASRVSRHLPHELAHFREWRGPGEIRLRNDSCAASTLIHDRNPAELVLLHRRHDVLNRVIGLNRDHRLRHAALCRVRDRILAIRHNAADDVSIGHHTDGLIVHIHDRNLAAIVLDHHLRDLIKRGVWTAAGRVRGHDVSRKRSHLWFSP
jgi:hypothetical protein